MRLVQIRKHEHERRVAAVDQHQLLPLDIVDSVYDLAQRALAAASRWRTRRAS